MPYPVRSYEPGYENAGAAGHGILDLVWDIDQTTGHVFAAPDRNGVPYTVVGYHNGPGYRGTPRVDPRTDLFRGLASNSHSRPCVPGEEWTRPFLRQRLPVFPAIA
jgi:hypothetical protein